MKIGLDQLEVRQIMDCLEYRGKSLDLMLKSKLARMFCDAVFGKVGSEEWKRHQSSYVLEYRKQKGLD